MVNQYKKFLFFLIVILLSLLCIYLVGPYFVPVISSIMLAITFSPVYKLVKKVVRFRPIASFITCCLIILLILVPTIFTMYAVFNEIIGILQVLQQSHLDQAFLTTAIDQHIAQYVSNYSFLSGLSFDTSSYLPKLTQWFVAQVSFQIAKLPETIARLFIMMLLTYYLFIDGAMLRDYLLKLLPLTEKSRLTLVQKCKDVTFGVAYGQIITALVQGLVAVGGYYLFGLKAPIIWGIATAFFALLPFIGSAIIWIPASIFLFVDGLSTGLWWQGIGLLAYGAFVVSTIDNIIKPKLISTHANIHPGIVLLGVFGGLKLFGIVGIFAGPLILAILIQLFDILIDPKAMADE